MKNAYALQQALKCSPTMSSRLWKGDFKQIGISTLSSLCNLFNCETSDLLSVRVKTEKPVKEGEAVKAKASDSNLLTTIEAAERLGLSRKRVNDYINIGRVKSGQRNAE